MTRFTQVRRLRTPDDLRARLGELEVDLAVDDHVASAPGGALAQPLETPAGTCGNRFCILPMEGWDGTTDGRPTDLVRRRWRRFGESGAALIWGGEAVAVRHDGRANPNQLVISPATAGELGELREELLAAHTDRFGSGSRPVVGLQLTHSGRFSRPDGEPAPRVAYRHPHLDDRFAVTDDAVLSDDDLDRLVVDMVAAAALAGDAGFDFVDVKHCHGYLGHELLSAVDRPGRYGGDLEGRMRFVHDVVTGIADLVPDLAVGVRLSAFDLVPFVAGSDGTGTPVATGPYRHAFGGDGTGLGIDLAEPVTLLDALASVGVTMVCVTGGSPYYTPHVQRPAYFPPSDGYAAPEDPLVGVGRLLDVASRLKAARPGTTIVASGLSYLQDWLPNVAQPLVTGGGVDAVGVGRMALSYHDLPADVLAGRPLDRRRVCRTFSDCTTAPRAGLVSGCWPLDDFYKQRPDRVVLAAAKRGGPGASDSGEDDSDGAGEDGDG